MLQLTQTRISDFALAPIRGTFQQANFDPVISTQSTGLHFQGARTSGEFSFFFWMTECKEPTEDWRGLKFWPNGAMIPNASYPAVKPDHDCSSIQAPQWGVRLQGLENPKSECGKRETNFGWDINLALSKGICSPADPNREKLKEGPDADCKIEGIGGLRHAGHVVADPSRRSSALWRMEGSAFSPTSKIKHRPLFPGMDSLTRCPERNQTHYFMPAVKAIRSILTLEEGYGGAILVTASLRPPPVIFRNYHLLHVWALLQVLYCFTP
ncbi:predicted protein [Histoplasma mississippiense (nom. inval.)]|uniref:predicted protein n=1 Tax=Ajellomyces capsulatus (strain NAm1 / WU24) TaxID=2059318 RepID=UPI000157B55E|nr:predicted protein [Histoplasma mississippiense (nom. inval.)]EDN02603.1 predicted protein [Histoplasma mississippiense (nom. inval.)]